MDGLLLIDKPEGMTSTEIVRLVKRRVGCKTGHLGTLDPFASGILPICIGDGTKIAQFLNVADKEYMGRIRLGSATDTGDPTGTVIRTAAVPAVTSAKLEEVGQSLMGGHLQTPPMYSALKRDGTPLYKLARQGMVVDRAPRPVRITKLECVAVAPDIVELTVACSKGTYVRVLAEEIATRLGTVGHLEALRRLRFGGFHCDDAIALDALERASLSVISLRESLAHVREIVIDAVSARRARQGYQPLLASFPSGEPNELVKLVAPDGHLASVIVMDPLNRWRFARVFAEPGTAT